MKTNYFTIWLLCCCHILPAWAQLTTDDTQTIDAVIQSLVGNGVTVSNIQKNCPDGAWGAFLGEESNLGMPKGLILTSGKIQNAEGPNTNGSISQSNLVPGDTDLNNLIVGFTSQDACVVTFDLQAISDTIQFNYIFGSEEYLEYVGSNFNDIFGFFISGPNPAGGSYNTQNIALISGTNTPVSINNVNMDSYPEYYIENGNGFSSPENTDDFYIQYDGFTTVLTARAAVVPCQTYTLKLAVADVGDTALDSGVFIEAGSLTTNKIELSATTSLADLGLNDAVEGCIDAIIEFRPSGTVIDTTIVFFDLTGSAQNGVDYTGENGLVLPNSITLYPGDTIAQIILAPIMDGIDEGTETVSIQISSVNLCETIVDTVVINIQDNIQASAAPDNIGTCPGSSINLWGMGGITSQWVPPTFLSDATIPNPVCTPTQSIMYTYITTVGPCVDSATVNVLLYDSFVNNAGIIDIVAPNGTACTSSFTPIVTLRNFGTAPLNNVQIIYRVDSNPPSTHNWSGTLATNATVNINLPMVSTTNGNHTFTAYTQNPNGATDCTPTNDTNTSSFSVESGGSGAAIPLFEGFENPNAPNNGWTVSNYDSGIGWERSTAARKTGLASVFVDNYNYEAAGAEGSSIKDDLISPPINLSALTNANLTFQVAYASYSAPGGANSTWDTLQVAVVPVCGDGSGFLLYNKYSAELATAPNTTNAFVPNSSQWRLETINLTPYISQGLCYLVFRNISHYENNLYIDDININGIAVGLNDWSATAQQLQVIPNPFSQQANLRYTLDQATDVSLTITDLAGKTIYQQPTTQQAAGTYDLPINSQMLPAAGMYIVQMQQGTQLITQKLVKQ